MAKISFVGPAYTARSINADTQRAINCYLELDNASKRAPIALYGTPGLVHQFTLPQGPVRAVIREVNRTWWIAGNGVYMVLADYTIVTLGTIATSAGPVSMASSGAQILVVDGVGGWTVNNTGVFPITDPDFPNGVRQATFQDGYFIVTGDGSGKFYISAINDSTQWDGTEFASAEGSPDYTQGCISDHRELWLFGDNSAEVWVNTGNVDFPFERSANAFVEVGTASASTIAKLDNTILWLGQDDRGAGIVWKMNGYTPFRVSNHAIEFAIQSYAIVSDALAFTYQQEGHAFYVLTFPSAGATWVYDVSTEQWHERAWRNPDLNTLTRWRPNCHVLFNNVHLVGDFETGDVYALDLDAFTDNGDPILRLRTTQTLEREQRYQFFSSLQVDMQTGVGLALGQGSDPKLMLRFSDDGGHSWSNIKETTIGRTGQYSARARFTRLGKGRNRVWEISMTDPVKFAVFGADCDYTSGAY